MIAMAAKTYTTYPLLLFCGRTGDGQLFFGVIRGVRHGVSKGLEDGLRMPALWVATLDTAIRLF
jgi:hypothetical protein